MVNTSEVRITKALQAHYDKIFQDGYLIHLHIRKWGMGVSLSEDDLDIDEKLPDIIKLGRKMLIDPKVIARFNNLEGKARRYLYRNSFLFPISDAHFIPKKKFGDVIIELSKRREEFMGVANEFFTNYETHKKDALAKYKEYAEVLTPYYPGLEKVKEKFSFEISIFELAMPKNLENVDINKLIDREKATEEVKNHIENEMRVQYQNSMARIEQFTDEAAKTLRFQVVDTCQTLVDKIKKNEIISRSNILAVKEQISHFRELNFLDDKVVERELDSLEKIVDGEKNYKTDQDAIKQLNTALESVITEAKNISDIRYVSGEYFRPVNLE